MDKRLTVHNVMAMRPCSNYGHERVKALWAGRESLSPLEVLDLDIPIEDRLWCVLRPKVISERTCRILACDFAGHVLPIFEAQYPADTRPRVAIETAIRYLDGHATWEELNGARSAALCARYAAWDAASDAAWDAASDAARAAVWAADGDAFWAAADGDAEREWQLARAREVLSIEEAPDA